MIIRANIRVGETTFQLEPKEGKTKEMLFELIELANELEKTPIKCDLCGSDDVVWLTTKTKEKNYKYIKRWCRNCKATATMGERTEDGMVYWRKSEAGKLFTPFTPTETGPQPAQTNQPIKTQPPTQSGADSSIPF